ncbi:MAG: hypothetical protein Q7S66_01170 [bacterium]|nr:hypothetical protein [bacterium]
MVPTITLKKILTISILLLAYSFILMSFSNTFDYDFGWHLRFGKDLWQGNGFPYLDTYTYTWQNKLWINHEWLTDWLYWLIYNNLGYFALQVFLSLPIIFGWLIIFKAFRLRLGLTTATITFLSVYAIQPVLISRPAMFLPLFLSILLYWLENITKQTNYYLWPLLFWIWSALHGSWILGFIVIDIYIAGNIINSLAAKFFPQWQLGNCWTKREYKIVLIWSFLSALIILINPYGYHLWAEVLSYFGNNYYKTIITEWVPSYTFPIYLTPLVIMAGSIPLVWLGIKNKTITWAQTLLYAAFWCAAWLYKRHMLIFCLIATPLLAHTCTMVGQQLMRVETYKNFIKNTKTQTALIIFGLITTILLLINFISATKFTNNIWQETDFLTTVNEPAAAAEWLNQQSEGKPIIIFNYFNWGGFLEWALPSAQLYFDGRGTATWMYDNHTSLLEHYRGIALYAGGLKEIETGPTQYIIWQKNGTAVGQPDWINKLAFPNIGSVLKANSEPLHLEKMLDRSKNWKKIYEDDMANIWQRRLP